MPRYRCRVEGYCVLDLGLLLALGNFVKEWSKYSGIAAEFNSTGFARAQLDFETETNLYRIAQEALNNVQKHARATRVSVLLNKKGANVSLIVEDDGVGFNPKDKKNRTQGIGLTGMSERAKLTRPNLWTEQEEWCIADHSSPPPERSMKSLSCWRTALKVLPTASTATSSMEASANSPFLGSAASTSAAL